MRSLETLLFVLLLPFLIGQFFPRARRSRWLPWLLWTALALIPVHLAVEQYRWQMVPAYGLAVCACLGALRKAPAGTAARLVGLALALLAYTTSLILASRIPVFRDPAPSGPYPVGTTSFRLVDSSRDDPFAPAPRTPRELLVVAWYPAAPVREAQPEPFWPDSAATGRALAILLRLPPLNFLRHLRLVPSHSYPDAPMAARQPQFPVLVFSHGYASWPRQNTVQMQELASHGFILFSLGHTYESAAIAFPGGRVAPMSHSRRSLLLSGNPEDLARAAEESLRIWVADTTFLVDELARINAGTSTSLFAHRLDLTRLGVFGMSFGGAAAGQFCIQDARCKAGLNMDGLQYGSVRERPLAVPFLYFAAAGNTDNDPIYANSRAPLFRLEIRGAKHLNFSDLNLVLPILRNSRALGSIDGMGMESIMSAYTLAFFDKYLNGLASPLLEGPPPAGRYPEVVFTSR